MKRLSIALAVAFGLGIIGCTLEQEAPEIKVESISIDQEDITLTEGESVTLTATVLPENAVDQSIKWSSSDESVVMVSSTGKIAAISVGNASVKAEAGEQSDFISVTVIQGTSGEVDPNSYDDISVTGEASSVTYISAELSGYAYLPFEIADATVGFIYSTDQNPSLDNETVVYGGDLDANCNYSSVILGLSASTTYYYRTFVRNGRSYRFGKVKSFATPDLEPALDLGLSVKWASANLGAIAPDEYGDFFAWGEISPKEDYNWSTYKWCNGDGDKLTKYCYYSSDGDGDGEPDGKTVLDPEDDVAHVKLGGKWRMPTIDEWHELFSTRSDEHYQWVWKSMNGHNGWFVTHLVNNNTIFLPSAGRWDKTYLNDYGFYWSSSLSPISHWAWYMLFRYDYVNSIRVERYLGLSVRPVYGDFIYVSDIVLDKTTIELNWGETAQLNATLSPSDAFEKSICWRSSNTEVAIVSSTGLVTGTGEGDATITATSVDGGFTASCVVSVNNKPEIDLGLSVEWATCNLGATKPHEYGDYYAWGETETKSDYSWSTYKFGTSSSGPFSKYNTNSSYGTVDNKTVLDPEDDVAHVKLGGNWRMPTDEEWTELRTHCTWEWTTKNGVKGRKVTGPNGNSIFLPAAGDRYDTGLSGVGSFGSYWSSSLNSDEPYYAWYVYVNSGSCDWYDYDRCFGRSVRPVSE